MLDKLINSGEESFSLRIRVTQGILAEWVEWLRDQTYEYQQLINKIDRIL